MNKENKNVFEETVETLTNDVLSLQQKFHRAQEKGDIQACINCLRLLKDTLSLIKEYDWELKYSEYKTDEHKEVAVWEQNHSGEIRNHKKWVVNEQLFSRNTWETLFSPFIKNEQSILFELSYDKDAEKEYRNTGKSTAIESLAIQYDIPILTSIYRASDFNKRLNQRQFRDYTTKAFSTYNEARGYSDFFLVDEGFKDESLLKDLIENHDYTLIGFVMKK